MPDARPLTLVVGRGGLLGRHVEAEILARGGELEGLPPVSWGSPAASVEALGEAVEALVHRALAERRQWRLLWCAGAGVVATSPAALAAETRLVANVLDRLSRLLRAEPGAARRGLVFHASSAGGVYSASPAPPPFDETSPTLALAPYGREKLAQEELFRALGDRCGSDVLIGRLTNLYGPGQKLSKPQGLISHVGWAAIRRRPIAIYVPLDTIRDYLYAPDAGCAVVDALARVEGERSGGSAPQCVTRIFGSERETTVASVLGAWRQALRRPLRVAFGASPVSRLQPRVLSFRSRVWTDLRRPVTPLTLGVDAIHRDQLTRLLAGGVGP